MCCIEIGHRNMQHKSALEGNPAEPGRKSGLVLRVPALTWVVLLLQGWKPERTHHDSMAGRCVLKMDHYCAPSAPSPLCMRPGRCTHCIAVDILARLLQNLIVCKPPEMLCTLLVGGKYPVAESDCIPLSVRAEHGCTCRRVDSKHGGPLQLQGVPAVSVLHVLGVPARGLHAARRGRPLLPGPG